MGNGFLGTYKARNENDVTELKDKYSDIANERLRNIAQGDNWNPWLAMKQAITAPQLSMAEGRVEGVGDANEGYAGNMVSRIADRSSKFDSLADQAEQYFTGLEAAKAQGPEAVAEFKRTTPFPKFQP